MAAVKVCLGGWELGRLGVQDSLVLHEPLPQPPPFLKYNLNGKIRTKEAFICICGTCVSCSGLLCQCV